MMFYFVILHYLVEEETIECVESILEQYRELRDKIRIVLVDNASPNGSGQRLKERYSNHENVVVLLNSENIGFARGNNIGYRYAKSAGADFIIQVNNDTIFKDESFLSKIEELYAREAFAVLGPDIRSLYDGEHQNPLKGFPINQKNILYKIFRNRVGVILAKMGVDQLLSRKIDLGERWKCSGEIADDMTLHACCFIFSPLYIEAFEGMFDKTFMYYEEDILKYLCMRRNLKMYYSNELYLIHKRSISTKQQINKSSERNIFVYRQRIHSLKEFKKLL